MVIALSGLAATAITTSSVAHAGELYIHECNYSDTITSVHNVAPAFDSIAGGSYWNTPNECSVGRSLEINVVANVAYSHGSQWRTTVPPGLLINSAYVPNGDVIGDCKLSNGDGFVGEFFWSGGSQLIQGSGSGGGCALPAISKAMGQMSSSYFAWQAYCADKSGCRYTSTGDSGELLGISGISLGAQETRGPGLVAVGSGNQQNLFYANGWVRGVWPANLTASDPSGVCAMTVAGNSGVIAAWQDPAKDQSNWTQCHDRRSGQISTNNEIDANVDTGGYASGTPLTLAYAATNAAGVTSPAAHTVGVDNEPVSLSLSGPRLASSAAGPQVVTATAAAGPSGVGGIACSLDGGSFQAFSAASARVGVSGIGPHVVQCEARNNAVNALGQDATSPLQSWSLDIGQPTLSAISFTRIVGRLHCRRLHRRIRLPGRWVVVYRHHRRTRIHVRSRTKTVTVEHCRRPHLVKATIRRVPFGRGTTVSGWLGTASGLAIAGQPVRILTAPDDGQSHFTQAAIVRTGRDGAWSVKLGPGPSRLVAAAYGGSPTLLPAVSPAIRLSVPARVLLSSIHPRRTPWGGTIRIVGRVLGGHIPTSPQATSQLLRLDIGVRGLSKIQGIPGIRPDGRFAATYTFNPGSGVIQFWFRVSTLREVDYPFAPGRSRKVTVTVGVPRGA